MKTNSKWNRKPFKFTKFTTKGHIFVGIVWPVVGSRGDQYHVEMHDNGFTCTCTGFTMHGKCKHIHGVYRRITDEKYPRYRWTNV